MSAETIVYSALKDDAGIVAAVGAKVYPGLMPQKQELPGVVFMRLDTEYVNTIHAGAALGSKAIMEIWGLAKAFQEASDLGDAIDAAMGVANLQAVARRSEIDPETEAHASILTFWVWE